MDRSAVLTARRIAPILGWVALLIAWLFVVAPGLWAYSTGTATTAHVDQCKSRRTGKSTRTTCYGSWTVHGVRRSGKIDGTDRDNERKDIRVRAGDSGAITMDTPRMALMMTGLFLVVGVIVHVVLWVQFTRMMRQ